AAVQRLVRPPLAGKLGGGAAEGDRGGFPLVVAEQQPLPIDRRVFDRPDGGAQGGGGLASGQLLILQDGIDRVVAKLLVILVQSLSGHDHLPRLAPRLAPRLPWKSTTFMTRRLPWKSTTFMTRRLPWKPPTFMTRRRTAGPRPAPGAARPA